MNMKRSAQQNTEPKKKRRDALHRDYRKALQSLLDFRSGPKGNVLEKELLQRLHDHVSPPNMTNFEFLFAQALACLHQKSSHLERSLLKKDKVSTQLDLFDVIVIGAGIHDQIIQNVFREEDVQLRILTIERSRFIADTFFAAGTRVHANSSSRPSGPEEVPVPGVGNINEFPLGILQVPYVSSEKYPSLGLFAKVATVNRWLSCSDVLFGWEVTNIAEGNHLRVSMTKMTDELASKPVRLDLLAQVVIDARGIGDPLYPSFLEGTDSELMCRQARKKFFQTTQVEGFPIVSHSKFFYSVASCLDQPFQAFIGKKVAMIGAGDSAKTILEFTSN
eukprot:Lithocolla_globosa_v1_NODE_41_length_8221_cov_7.943914.p3 type:complete len:334 gc:universal NODE_41_length_8221_cov_7.943914:7974-6973(-)